MGVHNETWENRLLVQAYEPLEDRILHDVQLLSNRAQTRRAYDHCQAVTRKHSRTFFTAAHLLPADQRRAVHALYAFCRVSDDLVDRGSGDIVANLQQWRQQSLSDHPPIDDPVALAWADTRSRYSIPRRYAEQLLDGVARDLTQTRYDTFADLTDYCYAVASTVGLMSMHIVGYAGKEAIPYAVKLGVALQLTNILRDVGEDWGNGRLYLPQDELADFGLTEADIARGQVDERWRTFMRFQIERTRRLYDEAMPGVALLGRRGRFAIAAAADLYRGILDSIEVNDYDVFHHRARVDDRKKIRQLPGIWWRSRFDTYQQKEKDHGQ